MSELSLLVSIFVTAMLLHPASALQLIGAQTISKNVSIGQPELINIIIYNDANTTYTSSINLTGNVTQIAKLLNDTITINSFELGNIYLNVSADTEGVWTGQVAIEGLSIPITISSQRFHLTKWFSSGDVVNIQPGDYQLSIQNITESKAYIVTSQHGYVLQGKLYSIGEGFSTSDFSFKVLDIYQSVLKLEIISNYPSTSVSVSKEVQQQAAGIGFSFYTTEYANTIETGATIKENFILRNGLNVPVQLKQIQYSGTVVTSEGRQPINAVQYELGLMQPGEERTFVIEINTKGLSPGVWTPIFYVKGLTQDNQIVTASISFVLTVTKAITSPSPANLTVSYPEQVVAEQPFNITVSGLSSGMTVDMEPNPHLIGLNVTQKEDTWTWEGKIDVNETQQVTIYVKLLGGVFKTFKFNLTVPKPPEPVQIFAPQLVWVGDKFTVRTEPTEASIDINGTKYTSPAEVVLLLPGNYVIKATKEGYQPSETTIKVISPVQANVSNAFVGKTATISFSEEGTYYLMFDNQTIKTATGKTLSFEPQREGIYMVVDSLGHQIISFEVKKQGFSLNLPQLNTDFLMVVLFVAIIVVLILISRKGKAKARNIVLEAAKSPLELEPE